MKKSIGARTIAYPTPVFIVGSYNKQNKPNIMAVAWGGICCSQPPCITISLRKSTYTYGNIAEHKAFTVSIPSERYVKQADYIGLFSGRDVDKFAACGLTAVKSKLVDAPYVAEFPLVIECKLLRMVELGQHTQFIGEILDIKCNQDILNQDNLPDVEKARPIIFIPGTHTYYSIGKYLADAFYVGKHP